MNGHVNGIVNHVQDHDSLDLSPSAPFRVIVVGGGVTGLVASHIFQKAGIDHVVLERGPDAAPATGASIAIYPHGSRILEQIDCLEAMKKIDAPMDRLVHRKPDGSVLLENDYWGEIRKNHVYDLIFFERREFLQTLYDQLPSKAPIKLNKKVTDIKEFYNGVRVSLADGTTEKGDIVIGCDGIHSLVRQKMWDNADSVSPGLITIKERKTMMTSWTCLVGMGPGTPGLRSELSCTHNNGYNFLIGTQPHRTFFFVFFRVDKPYSQYTRPRWTEKDANEAALKVLDHPISENLVFGDVWKRRLRAQMVDIEEGVLERWYFGRTVLVGDAAHKVTPNIALGGNSGMESISLLASLIQENLAANPTIKPSRATLQLIFQTYQNRRIPRMRKIQEFSNMITRVQAWDGVAMKTVANWVLPYQNGSALGLEIGGIIKGAEKISFLEVSRRNGRIKFDDEVEEDRRKEGALKVKVRETGQGWGTTLLGGLVVLSSIVLVFLKIPFGLLKVDVGN